MIVITHIKWDGKKIGIALRKLQKGLNHFVITAKNKRGIRMYPHVYEIDREDAIEKYGISTINNNSLQGIWIPLSEIKEKEEIWEE